MIEKGLEVEIEIFDVAFGGKGCGRLEDGRICFVPFTAPGDTVKVEITNVHKRHCEAKLVELVTPSANRVAAKCEYYETCGGCDYQHIAYGTQVELKKAQFENILKRIGQIEELPEDFEIVPSPKQFNYRNKITLAPFQNNSGRFTYGFVGVNHNDRIAIKQCEIADEEINKLIPKAHKTPWARKNEAKERPQKATARKAAGDDAIIFYGYAPKNIPWSKESINNKEVRVPLGSFYQINPEMAEILFNKVSDWTKDLDVDFVIDAFCGSGFLSLAIEGKRTLGLEIDEQAVEVARHNAEQWGHKNHRYQAADVNKSLKKHLRKDKNKKLLILDPPRAGFSKESATIIAKVQPEFILYVSCEPSTLARDLKGLNVGSKYELKKAAALDMFPQTSHFESMVLLELKK